MARRVRVLIVDDRPRSRNGLRALLATWPEVEVVCEATNGSDAVNSMDDCHPDVVLMDAKMPVMDGLEAARHIKTGWPEVKVILLTMYPSYRENALSSGVDAFLVKGCPAAELQDAILDDPQGE